MPNWGHVLKEIQSQKNEPAGGESASDKVRKKYLMQLHSHLEQRNVICYYSGWLSKHKIEGVEITDEDKNGFMLCVDGLDRNKGLDLILHTPGGSVAATESLVNYLKEMFGNDIRAFVPQLAMSAGTMIACSCKEIWMGKHSNIGPVDPQINGIPAYAVVREIETAYEDIKKDQFRQVIWRPILSRYTPGFVQRCHWAIKASKELVATFLQENMFSSLSPEEGEAKAARVVEKLTDLVSDKGHDKHLHYKECKEMGLEIRMLEEPGQKTLQDLILTVHHCYMYTLSNTPAFKVIENHTGRRYVKIEQHMVVVPKQQAPTSPAPSGPAH
jgi:ClpP class serine protease